MSVVDDRNTAPTEDMWLLVVHPALTRDLTAWVAARGLWLRRMPTGPDELPTWTTTPTDEAMLSRWGRQ